MKQETAQHTLGPWQLNAGIDGAVIHNDVTIASIPLDAISWKANARLIAAAPLLLEALGRILYAHESPPGASIGEAKLCPMLADMARAAIAATQQ